MPHSPPGPPHQWVPCSVCNTDGFIAFEDRPLENRTASCATCRGRGWLPTRTGETPEASAPKDPSQ